MEKLRKALPIVGLVLLVPIVALGALAVSARLGDGPSVLFAGGPLVAGDLVAGPEPDWAEVASVGTIELQLLDPPRSRAVWIAEHDGKAYVLSGYMGTAIGRMWKQWPLQAERDGRAVVRIGNRRYLRSLVRVQSGPVVEPVLAEFNRKYGYNATAADVAAGQTWVFELAPPKGDFSEVPR